jgi:hypothetical protein
MKCETYEIQRLIEEVEKKAGVELTYKTSVLIWEKIRHVLKEEPAFKEEYLYKHLQSKLRKAGEEKDMELSLNEKKISSLLRYLGYRNFAEFREGKDHPASQLGKFIGVWRSYVRCNSKNPFLLSSPVRIYAQKSAVYMELAGPERNFKGELLLSGERVYCLLNGDHGKQIFLVMNGGIRLKPDVLQGVFAGISSAGDPIAGREVLIRQSLPFEELRPLKIDIDEWLRSANEEEAAIAKYFAQAENNIIKSGRSSSFDIGDLKVT